MNRSDVGIDQLGVYIPRYALPLDRLAEARGVPVRRSASVSARTRWRSRRRGRMR
jgi:3-hydroxy-3-methylglutaryl CoA synthase